MANDVMVAAEGVRHVYRGGRVALDEVSLAIGTGLFGLLGSNGAGKSTLMRILCTLIVPTKGTVRVGGHDVLRERRLVRGLIGYLPQEFGAWRLQRVEEVVDTLAALSGLRDKALRRRRVTEVIESVGLGKVADRKVKQLSGGMLRRLGVAQALVHEPRVLVVDEPTVGLDPEERLRFRQLMATLGRDRTVVLSTHIVADLGSGCADLAIINHGRLRFRGAPVELLRQAQDKVFEVTVPAVAEADVMERLEIVRRVATGGSLQLRGVLRDGQPPAGATPVADVTLEEAYLAFMLPHGLTVDTEATA